MRHPCITCTMQETPAYLCIRYGSMSRLAQKWFAQVLAKAHFHGKETRVVVTGQGVVSSLGQNVDEFYNNLLEVMDRGANMVNLFSNLPVINSCYTQHVTCGCRERVALLQLNDLTRQSMPHGLQGRSKS